MELVEFISMVNSFDEATKVNMKKIQYDNEERSEASNICGNSRSNGVTPPMIRDLNPLYDEIYNTRVPDLQVGTIFDTYNGDGDYMACIKSFKMKFKLKFRVNDNFMAKNVPTIFKGYALNWYFSLPPRSINFHAQVIS